MLIVMILMRIWLVLSLSAAAPVVPTGDNEAREDTASVDIVNGDDINSDALHSHSSENANRYPRRIYIGGDVSIDVEGNNAKINMASIFGEDASQDDPVSTISSAVDRGWSNWSKCSKECGGGKQTRTRTMPFSPPLIGDDIETKYCNIHPCDTPCTEPFAVPGHCKARLLRWSYNQETGICRPFLYGGCQGNNNNFDSKEVCAATCQKSVTCPHKDNLSDVLLENNWRIQDQINAMSEEEKRNTVIVEVEKMTGHTTADLQRRANTGDLESLTAIANMATLLTNMEHEHDGSSHSILRSSDVKTMTYGTLRNTLITEISRRFSIQVSTLQSKTDHQLLKTFCKASCLGTESDWDCCSSTSPCQENEGDCDSDSECAGSLVCGTDNCINPLAHHEADCCFQPGNSIIQTIRILIRTIIELKKLANGLGRKFENVSHDETEILNIMDEVTRNLKNHCTNKNGFCKSEELVKFIKKLVSTFENIKETGKISSGFLNHFEEFATNLVLAAQNPHNFIRQGPTLFTECKSWRCFCGSERCFEGQFCTDAKCLNECEVTKGEQLLTEDCFCPADKEEGQLCRGGIDICTDLGCLDTSHDAFFFLG